MFAVLETVLALVNAAITLAVINPIMTKALQGQIPANSAGMVAALQQGGAVAGVVISLVVPVWILLVMFRPNVKAAFATGGALANGGAGGHGGYAAPQQPQGPYGQQ